MKHHRHEAGDLLLALAREFADETSAVPVKRVNALNRRLAASGHLHPWTVWRLHQLLLL